MTKNNRRHEKSNLVIIQNLSPAENKPKKHTHSREKKKKKGDNSSTYVMAIHKTTQSKKSKLKKKKKNQTLETQGWNVSDKNKKSTFLAPGSA